jgi:hypothetical protein
MVMTHAMTSLFHQLRDLLSLWSSAVNNHKPAQLSQQLPSHASATTLFVGTGCGHLLERLPGRWARDFTCIAFF